MFGGVHYIASEPDTIIVLTNACVNFAPWKPAPAETEAPVKEEFEREEEEIHYLVSSAHLIQVSPVFQRSFKQNGFSKATWDKADEFFHAMASEWDAQALLIVFQIVHLCNKPVPNEVSLDLLAKIAVVAEYLQL